MAQVQRLLRAFERTLATSQPSMIVYVAPSGWGKTRIIQEFYASLAARQPSPRYWPGTLLGNHQEVPANGLELGYERKSVRHRDLVVPDGARLPWLWLAPASGRLSDGSAAPVLESATRQITRHLPHLIARGRLAGIVMDDLYRAISRALTPTDIVALADTDEIGDDLLRSWQAWRAATPKAERMHYEDELSRATALSSLLATLVEASPEPLGVVVVLDDAHDLDSVGTTFVANLLSMQLPVLIVATAWPDRLVVAARPQPFPALVSEASNGERVVRVDLAELEPDDLIEYILGTFPGTDPHTAMKLAQRADRNPYALRLLLNLPRVVDSVRDGRITLAAAEIAQIRGGLVDLLGEHWTRLPLGVQQVLVAASLLGESTLDDVLQASLAEMPVNAGISDAYASTWIRPVHAAGRIVEFVERLRYEVVLDRASSVFTEDALTAMLTGALRSVRQQLTRDTDGFARSVLLTLHVALARAGIETETALAATSAMELAERARDEHRRRDAIEYLQDAVVWLNASGEGNALQLVRCLVALSDVQRAEYSLNVGEPYALQAVELADARLDANDEWRVRARIALARSRRRREEEEAYASARELASEAGQLMSKVEHPSAEVVRSLRSLQADSIGADGDRARADRLYSELVDFCRSSFGPSHRWTLNALESWAYQAQRAGVGQRAIALRREVLARRTELAGTAGSLQTAPARNNLAVSLLEYGGEAGVAEADRLAAEAYAIWSRTYGENDGRTMRAKAVRARVSCRRGLAHEARDDHEAARAFFELGRQLMEAVVAMRRGGEAAALAISLQRLGFALGCLRDPESLRVLNVALRIREDRLGQVVGRWEVTSCAATLVWANLRIGRPMEADIVQRRYGVGALPALETDFAG